MKKTAIILGLMLIASAAQAQFAITSVALGRSYAANDTTYWTQIPSGQEVACYRFRDSVNVKISIDYAFFDTTVYQTYAAVADSTNSTTDAGCFKSYVLRNASTNNIPGAIWVRSRLTRLTTRNGTTSPTYDLILKDN